MMEYLQRGRADIALTNTVDGILILKKLRIKDIVPLEKPLAVLDLYHYIHQDHKHLVAKVDAMIQQMQESEEMDALIKSSERQVIENNISIDLEGLFH